MKKEKCPYLIRGCQDGIRCEIYFGGNFLMDSNAEVGKHGDLKYYNEKTKRTDAQEFRDKICKNEFSKCKLYSQYRFGGQDN